MNELLGEIEQLKMLAKDGEMRRTSRLRTGRISG